MSGIRLIEDGKAVLGIELGSTRIKAVLIDEKFKVIASGSYDWENRYENGIWTYSLDDVWVGIRQSYKKLSDKVKNEYGCYIKKLKSIGFSGMMHGYLAFDKDENQIAEFRTWRNTSTGKSAEILTKELEFNIPQRWSIAHLYQAILNDEDNVKNINYLTTLSGYVHWKLSGQKVMGVGDASGMFPIDSKKSEFNSDMLRKFDTLIDGKYLWSIKDILPKVLNAGDEAGVLTECGAKLLDPTGNLESGCPMCPPEGDAGTGMVATNSVTVRTGNVSAGTSIFAMIVLEKELSKVYEEIDIVTTPTGKSVAMVHCNNCSSDIDAWANLFREFCEIMGKPCSIYEALDALYYKALEGDTDCGDLVSYNYYSGEPITSLDEGRPLFIRNPDSKFNFANFARNLLYSAVATLKIGMDILTNENVSIDRLLGHGGFFKAKEVGQRILSSAIKIPVSVMDTAGEGGAWGIAVLASYCIDKSMSFDDYLNEKVFASQNSNVVIATEDEIAGFNKFIENYIRDIKTEKISVAK